MSYVNDDDEAVTTPRFDKTREFQERLLPALNNILDLCGELGIPAFLAFRIVEREREAATACAGATGGYEGYPKQFAAFMEAAHHGAAEVASYDHEAGTWDRHIIISRN